jgi:hypothetical protein
MKKYVLITVACLMLGSASAQIEKGSVLAGASSNLNFSSISPDTGDNYSLFDLSLKGGYFFMDNLTAGLNVGYQKIDDFSISTFGLFGRYYYQGKFFGGVGFNVIKYEDQDSQTSIPFEVGYAAFITPNIAVEPSLNLGIFEDYTSFGFRVGFSLYLNRSKTSKD